MGAKAWLALSLALLLHVIDEAAFGFLSVYNPTVRALRLPLPTFGFTEWLAGLLAAVALMLILTRWVGARWMRPIQYAVAVIMILNAAGHTAGTIAGRTFAASVHIEGAMPGFYSSPFLLGAAVWVLVSLGEPRRWALALAWTAMLAGIASLLLFGAFLWMGGLGLIDLGLSTPALLAWDAALSLLFFLQHSGMVRQGFHRRLAHWHGVVYTIASTVALVLVVVLWQRSPAVLLEAPTAVAWALRALLAASFALCVWGIVALGHSDLFGVQALADGLRGQAPPAAPLIAKGPYRFLRHPFYAAGIVAVWTLPVLTPDRLLFAALWTAWLIVGTHLEERDLAAGFGEPYLDYQRRVRRWGL